MRLQKYIAYCGISSRRKAEELIQQGKVMVNGNVVTDMGIQIDPITDTVYVNGQQIKPEQKKIYIMLNKPEGYITTLSDEFNRPTVLDLVKDVQERIYPVGRLDYDTSGLLLLTNDGQMAFKLTHPKHQVTKTYIATIKMNPTENQLQKLRKGVDIGGYITAPAEASIYKTNKDFCQVKISIHEGKNRQVRKMFEAIGHTVIRLKRISMGKLKLNELPKSKWRYLTASEIEYLKSLH